MPNLEKIYKTGTNRVIKLIATAVFSHKISRHKNLHNSGVLPVNSLHLPGDCKKKPACSEAGFFS